MYLCSMMIILSIIAISYVIVTISSLLTYGWYLSPSKSRIYLERLQNKDSIHWVSSMSSDTICSFDMPAIYPTQCPAILFKYTVMGHGVIYRFSPLHDEIERILKEGK
jgi:hypothetical protein